MDEVNNGTKRRFGDKSCVYYDGYWIRYNAPPKETLLEKKNMIERLTRRAFHHMESGINTPSEKLELARVQDNSLRRHMAKLRRIGSATTCGPGGTDQPTLTGAGAPLNFIDPANRRPANGP